MKKITLILLLLIGAPLMYGCQDLVTLADNCPFPSKDQSKDGFLLLQNGITLKCQIKKYTPMPCVDVRDSDGTEVLVCRQGKRHVLLTFDEKGILKGSKWHDVAE
jgi:hypothetical protein